MLQISPSTSRLSNEEYSDSPREITVSFSLPLPRIGERLSEPLFVQLERSKEFIGESLVDISPSNITGELTNKPMETPSLLLEKPTKEGWLTQKIKGKKSQVFWFVLKEGVLYRYESDQVCLSFYFCDAKSFDLFFWNSTPTLTRQ